LAIGKCETLHILILLKINNTIHEPLSRGTDTCIPGKKKSTGESIPMFMGWLFIHGTALNAAQRLKKKKNPQKAYSCYSILKVKSCKGKAEQL
jgi:hypothetical protein